MVRPARYKAGDVLISAPARTAVLRESTRGNASVRREVEFLLNNSADVASFLEDPIAIAFFVLAAIIMIGSLVNEWRTAQAQRASLA